MVSGELLRFDKTFFSGHRVVIDPAMALHLVRTTEDPCRTLWVFRYYDLEDRQFKPYGEALARLIDFIRAVASVRSESIPKVNILAHFMGGLLVREAVQCTYPQAGRKADDYINKIVTLGTPHKGISFQLFENWMHIDAADEVKHFHPEFQKNATNPVGFAKLKDHFPLIQAKITRGKDLFGKSKFFFGVSIKPRWVDFDLFHQSDEAENCYGPFSQDDLSDQDVALAGPARTALSGRGIWTRVPSWKTRVLRPRTWSCAWMLMWGSVISSASAFRITSSSVSSTM